MKHELELLDALEQKDFHIYFRFENECAVLIIEDDDRIIEVGGIENFAALGQMFAYVMKEKAEEE